MLIFDLETDGLLDVVTKIHCLVIGDTETGNTMSYYDDTLNVGLKRLQEATAIGGHNVITYDIPVLRKLYNWKPDELNQFVHDTLIHSRACFPEDRDEKLDILRTKDWKLKPKGMPTKLYGLHSLEAWGWRLGEAKGEYGKQANAWEVFTPEMLEYCEQDVVLNMKVYKYLQSRKISKEQLRIEFKFADYMAMQTAHGITFDVQAAGKLFAEVQGRRCELYEKITTEWFPDIQHERVWTPKSSNKKYGNVKGVPKTEYTTEVFNPASGDHIARRLIDTFGWKPTAMTKDGKPSTDKEALASLDFPCMDTLRELQIVDKIKIMLSGSAGAWLNIEKNGRIHGRIKTQGAVTGRCTHSKPNLTTVPACHSPYGRECRSLFVPQKGWVMVGADASQLELRILAHYMQDPDYTDLILNGDIHTYNQEAAGLPTRDSAKTFIYAMFYGAGDALIGSQLGGTTRDGKKAKERFLSSVPKIRILQEKVQRKAKDQQFIYGIDGRKIITRSPHSALNALLQGSGAIVMKQALINYMHAMHHNGFIIKDNFNLLLNVHDEFQSEVKVLNDFIADIAGRLACEAIVKAGVDMRMKCPMAAEYKVGSSWADTH